MSDNILVPEFVPLPPRKNTGWGEILSIPTVVEYTAKFVIQGWRRKSTDVFKKIPHGRKRKRRRSDSTDRPIKRVWSSGHKTIGPRRIVIEMPTSMDDAQQVLVNALVGMLPMDAKMNIFGFWHSVVLVGVFYRHENLCWVLLNRLNHRLYITSHFVADSLHLFKEVRGIMQLTDKQNKKKWTRQGVNDAMCIFTSLDSMKHNQSVKMNTLPRGVLRFTRTQTALAESITFIKGVGKAGKLLRNFTRVDKPPPGFNPVTFNMTDQTCGWKVFRRTGTHGCTGSKKKPCTCGVVARQLQKSGFDTLGPNDAAMRLMTVLPSSLEKKSCRVLVAHYQPFIDHVKENPSKLYFPAGDVTVD
jgi:hypothetical protein